MRNNNFNYHRPLAIGLIFFFLLANTKVMYAQVDLGVRAGINFGTITNTSVESGSKRMAIGPGAGFIVSVPLTELFSLQTEALFNARGIAASAKNEGIRERGTRHLYYLDVPFIVRVGHSFQRLRLYGGTGPQMSVGLFVHNVLRISGDNFTNKFKETTSFSDKTRRYEMAWAFDVGLGIPLKGQSELEVNIRPVIGLINIAKEKFNELNNRNVMIAVSVAYVFKRQPSAGEKAGKHPN